MRLIIKITLLFTIIIAFISCSDDWLEPDPKSFYVPENVFINKAGFEAGLVTLRKDMKYECYGNRNPFAMEYAYSDLACSNNPDFRKLTPSQQGYWKMLSFYNQSYIHIKNCNVIISRIDDIEWNSQDDRNAILAEALWFRSYWYYRLVNTYGDVPWIGEELQEAKLDFYTYTRESIIDQIQKDLEYALQWLPVEQEFPGDVTKGAGNHLLTKVYLANTEFNKAVQSATDVINGPYSLMRERFGIDKDKANLNILWDLHRPENKQNNETIYTTIDRPGATEDARSPRGTYAMRMYNPAYWKVQDQAGQRATNWSTPGIGDTLGLSNADVRTNDFFHYSIWKDENYTWRNTPDLRRADENWIEMGDSIAEITTRNPLSPNFGEPLSRKYMTDLYDTLYTWYPFPIYKSFVPTVNQSRPYGGESDWYIFRLAETYLLRAEANYYLGQTSAAANDINVVRERANAPLISSDDITLDYIFDERARELYTEQPRHCEMVRASYILANLNKDGYGLDNFSQNNWYYDKVIKDNYFYTKEPLYNRGGNIAFIEPHNILWPIPRDVITENTKGRINQNIGYQGTEENESPRIEIVNGQSYIK